MSIIIIIVIIIIIIIIIITIIVIVKIVVMIINNIVRTNSQNSNSYKHHKTGLLAKNLVFSFRIFLFKTLVLLVNNQPIQDL